MRYLVEKGELLASMGYCTVCHTRQGGPNLSGGFALNLAQQREVERALTKVRAAGKHITCYFENAGVGHYQIAAQCDRILMADMGSVDLRSLALNTMHLKDAMDLTATSGALVSDVVPKGPADRAGIRARGWWYSMFWSQPGPRPGWSG